MKKMKKILGLVLAMAMVLGMSVTALADENDQQGQTPAAPATNSTTITGKPSADDKADVTIKNVEANATVTAYRIVNPVYDANSAEGFKGYESAKVGEGDAAISIVATATAPTAEEITDVAADSSVLTALTSESGFTQGEVKTTGDADEKGKADYTAKLGAGYWLVLITGTADVYNPMLVGVYYANASGDNNTLEGGILDSNSSFTINGVDVYAKSTKPSVDKKIVDKNGNATTDFDVATEETVYFQIDTVIPSYSEEYENATVKVKDELSEGLTLNQDSVKVYVDNTEITGEAIEKTYEITKAANGFTITFKKDYILSDEGRKTVRNVVVKYDATLDKDKAGINFDPNTNKATLTYTNKPGTDANGEPYTNETEDITYTYTFGIDVRPYGDSDATWNTITKELLKGEVVSETVNGVTTTKIVPLGGAEFELKNTATNKVYTSTSSNEEETKGYLSFKGLDAGSYTLKETKAPEGFSLNTKEYAVEISANYNEDGTLKDYTITIDGVSTTYKATYDENKTVTGIQTETQKEDGTTVTEIITTEIPNTRLSSLPSTGGIGTTIFTIGGCAIMIIAAGLYFVSRRKSGK